LTTAHDHMKFHDYTFDIKDGVLAMDPELDINSTDFQHGDIFRLELADDTNAMTFVRLSKLESFVLDSKKDDN